MSGMHRAELMGWVKRLGEKFERRGMHALADQACRLGLRPL